jgi:hypothetical protein
MKQMSLTTATIAASTLASAALLSFGWSEQRGLSLSVEKAEARVGRPLTCPCRKSNPLVVDRESGDAAARCWICAN